MLFRSPLVPGEPEEPGQPITPENPNPEEIGYLNTTRLTHIVKVYDIEHIDGTREHVTTTRRDNCPDIVDIQHEPDPKEMDFDFWSRNSLWVKKTIRFGPRI